MSKITEVDFSEYKGNPTIAIYEVDDKGVRKPYPFSFGVKKAELILKHIEEIKKFVEVSTNK